MRKTLCYCDVCGREVNAEDLIIFKAADFYRIFMNKWEICNDCLREIGGRVRDRSREENTDDNT